MAIEYRRIQPADLAAAAEFAIRGLRPDLYPMRLAPEKVDSTIRHFMHSTTDFHLGAFDGERVVGGIAAVVTESPWFERADATVVMCQAIVPGVGRRLLAALRAWMDGDMRIRRAFFPLEFDADPRMLRLLARYGFGSSQVVCIYHKV
jgi:hypothetical protein